MKLKLRSGASVRLRRVEDALRPRLVVIDDEAGNVTALEELLGDLYRVEGFTDPEAALASLRESPADVVLTDQRMPGLQGTDVLLRLKEEGQDPVAIIVTGYTDVKDLVFCINEGLLYRYVLKPWQPEDIRAAVRDGVLTARQRKALARLVPGQMVQRLFPEGLENLAPGRSQQLDCAVMLADLRGFSRVAETLSPSEAYELLAQFFELVTPLVGRHGGFIDKFLGDGVLAVFDEPGKYPAQAQACAREIVAVARAFSGQVGGRVIKPEGWRVGIGIASGGVTLGTIGCPDRVEITVLGDTVNTASRLEETCKHLGCEVLVDASLGGAQASCRPLGLVPLRGKEHLAPVSQLLFPGDADLAPTSALREVSERQRGGDLEVVLEDLRGLVAAWPEDRVLGRVLELWENHLDQRAGSA